MKPTDASAFPKTILLVRGTVCVVGEGLIHFTKRLQLLKVIVFFGSIAPDAKPFAGINEFNRDVT